MNGVCQVKAIIVILSSSPADNFLFFALLPPSGTSSLPSPQPQPQNNKSLSLALPHLSFQTLSKTTLQIQKSAASRHAPLVEPHLTGSLSPEQKFSSCSLPSCRPIYKHGRRYILLRRFGCQNRCHWTGNQEGIPQARHYHTSRQVLLLSRLPPPI